jgi:hypothetical protein
VLPDALRVINFYCYWISAKNLSIPFDKKQKKIPSSVFLTFFKEQKNYLAEHVRPCYERARN